MGFFGTFVFAEGEWSASEDAPAVGPSLRVDIHDSDIAQIDYRPSVAGLGRFYLGYEPAAYFGDPSASQPVNGPAQAQGFSDWLEQSCGRLVPADQLLPLLADPEGAEPEEPFAEDAVVKLLHLSGLPLPQALQPDR